MASLLKEQFLNDPMSNTILRSRSLNNIYHYQFRSIRIRKRLYSWLLDMLWI